jgi:hypothetical protein
MCTSPKKCLVSSLVFKPRLNLGQKTKITQTRTKKIHFLALKILHNYILMSDVNVK